jgi:hypothetical protein
MSWPVIGLVFICSAKKSDNNYICQIAKTINVVLRMDLGYNSKANNVCRLLQNIPPHQYQNPIYAPE